MDQNPYAPTKAALNESPYSAADAGALRLASKGRRFWNAVIDGIVCEVVAGLAGAILGTVTGGHADVNPAESMLEGWVLGLLVWLGYYVLMEGYLGATVGKFVTGTRVVTESAERPSLGVIWKRTWLRAIPFEAFSFFGARPGWHDRWSRTRVISIR